MAQEKTTSMPPKPSAPVEQGSRARKSAQRKAKRATEQFVSQKSEGWQKPLGVGKSPVRDAQRAAAQAHEDSVDRRKSADEPPQTTSKSSKFTRLFKSKES